MLSCGCFLNSGNDYGLCSVGDCGVSLEANAWETRREWGACWCIDKLAYLSNIVMFHLVPKATFVSIKLFAVSIYRTQL